MALRGAGHRVCMTFDAFSRNGLILVEHVHPFIDDLRMLRRAVDRGQLVRLRRGVYVDAATWAATDARGRHVFRVRAALTAARRPAIIAGMSAAALWGMPIAGEWPREVTVLDQWLGGGRSEPGLRRTAAGFATASVVELQGIRVTNLPRTALDVARAHSFVDAVGSVDWALWRRNEFATTAADLAEELVRLNPRVGCRHLERVVGFGTSLSGSFGESSARAVIHQLGFEAPELQAKFRDSQGLMETDFWWRGARIVGEFDGKQKYTREEYTNGNPGEVAWREKKREDRLRRLGQGMVRILTSHVTHPNTLERLLLDAGVPRGGGSY